MEVTVDDGEWLIAHLRCEEGQWKLSMTLNNEIMRQLREDGRVRITSSANRKIVLDLLGELPSSNHLELGELKMDEEGR